MSLEKGQLTSWPRVPELGPSRSEDFDQLFESGALLRLEELEEDPRAIDSLGYRRRVEEETRDGHTYVWKDEQGLCFRASVSAITADAAQISGSTRRGSAATEGSRRGGLAELCLRLFERTPGRVPVRQ